MIKNFGIRARLIGITILVSVSFVFISIYSYYSFQKVKRLNALSKSFYSVNKLSLELRRNEKDFMLRDYFNPNYFKTRESKNLTSFKKNMGEVLLILEDLKNDKDIIRYNLVQGNQLLSNVLHDYETKFLQIEDQIFKKGFQEFGIMGEFRDDIHEMEDILSKKFNQPGLMVHMLTLRRHEKDYLLRKDLSYYPKFISEYNIFVKAIDRTAGSLNDKMEAAGLLEEYKSGFEKLLAIDKSIGLTEDQGLNLELRNAVHKVEPAIDDLTRQIEGKTQEGINSSIFNLVALVIVVMVVLIVIITAINKRLGEVIESISSGAGNIAAASQQLSVGAEIVSQGATEQASSVEEISTSMEEMSSNIQQNTDNAQQTEKISHKASEEIIKVNESSERSLKAISEISEKIFIINEIAFQTNILALNAAVEAARAGDYGRGFAVVASEVRKLAEKSKTAADEIMNLSKSCVEVTSKSTVMMKELVPEIQKTSRLIQEISAASIEQNSGGQQINTAIIQLNQVTQQNAAAAEEMATSSEELATQADHLRDLIIYLKTGNKVETQKDYIQKKKPASITPTAKGSKVKKQGVEIVLNQSQRDDAEFSSY